MESAPAFRRGSVRNPVHRPDPLPARAAQLKGEGLGTRLLMRRKSERSVEAKAIA